MNRRTGLAIGAAAVSVTLGVLIGVVIHVGQSQHAGPSASEAASIVASSQAPTPIVVTPPSQGDAAPSGGNESAAPTAAVEPSAPSSAASPSPAAPGTPMTSEPPTADAPATASPTPSGATATTGTASVTGAVADAPCPSLAARSADPAGATLYCQVDPQTHVLQWRPVTDGGGCLSQKMTGQDAAGVQYLCRIDSTGHNHWVRA